MNCSLDCSSPSISIDNDSHSTATFSCDCPQCNVLMGFDELNQEISINSSIVTLHCNASSKHYCVQFRKLSSTTMNDRDDDDKCIEIRGLDAFISWFSLFIWHKLIQGYFPSEMVSSSTAFTDCDRNPYILRNDYSPAFYIEQICEVGTIWLNVAGECVQLARSGCRMCFYLVYSIIIEQKYFTQTTIIFSTERLSMVLRDRVFWNDSVDHGDMIRCAGHSLIIPFDRASKLTLRWVLNG